MKRLEGEALRRAIDEALEEIELAEQQVLELFEAVGGRSTVRKVTEHTRAQASRFPLADLRPGSSPGSSTEPPGTR